ncbi:hypothetical protein QTP88_005883 [Uroleucon formosanum]
MMHRLTAAVLAMLQCTAIFACQVKFSEVPRLRRSIIEVPLFVCDRFGRGQRQSVIGYDGQYRQMFEEAADDDGCCRAYYSPQRCTAQLPTRPEKSRSVINNDAWWLAVIENSCRNNEQKQHEMETKEACRKYQWVLSCSQ